MSITQEEHDQVVRENNRLQYQIKQLREQLMSLEGSIMGYREAVGRWRRRAQKEPEEITEPQLVTAKRRTLHDGWAFTQTYILPGVEQDPAFYHDAWSEVEFLGWEKDCREIFFHEKLQKWCAVLDKKW